MNTSPIKINWNKDFKNEITEVSEEAFYRDIYDGRVNEYLLPQTIYHHTANELMSGVFKGFGGDFTSFQIGTSNYEILKKFHKNIYTFSSAKTFHEVRDIQKFIFDDKGFKRSFSQFKKDAIPVFERYNGRKDWLRTEYNTAIAQANSSSQWQDIVEQADILPYLQFSTVKDPKVRPDHAEFEGLTRPVNDPIWDIANPPLGYNCRCIIIQLSTEEAKVSKKQGDTYSWKQGSQEQKMTRNQFKEEIDPMFRMNPGKDHYIFKDKGIGQHPYFKVPDKFKIFKEKNFGLPIPKV